MTKALSRPLPRQLVLIERPRPWLRGRLRELIAIWLMKERMQQYLRTYWGIS